MFDYEIPITLQKVSQIYLKMIKKAIKQQKKHLFDNVVIIQLIVVSLYLKINASG